MDFFKSTIWRIEMVGNEKMLPTLELPTAINASCLVFEASVMLAYFARNRSASIRIPYVSSPKAWRIKVRFPYSTVNLYFVFSAMMMAGVDGILNKIHPGEAMDKDLYDLPPEEEKSIPQVCHALIKPWMHSIKIVTSLRPTGYFPMI